MVEKQQRPARRGRTRWVAPAIAFALTALAVSLGQVAQSQILAQPDQPITFIVEDELPYGITQAAVDTVAATQAHSYEAFTVMVVERELTWDEYDNGELPDGVDVMISVGFDETDLDLSLPDTTRVSIAKLAEQEDWSPHYRLASEVRATFVNNLTQGQGPSAVVGAAMTAALGAFDGGTRSPIFWVSMAAIPLLTALLIMVFWARNLARDRAQKRVFARARLHLARVVLELDLLDAHVLIAGAELDRATDKNARKTAARIKSDLNQELADIRADSLKLAHEEQVLSREIMASRRDVHERGMPQEPMPLAEFTVAADALQRRTSALIAASSLRVGHTAGGDILGQIALETTLALDELAQHGERLTAHETRTLQRHRGDLLALLHEAESSFGTESGPEIVAAHSDLMARWLRVEKNLAAALTKIDRRLRRGPARDVAARVDSGALARRVQARARIASGGDLDTTAELREMLELRHHDAQPPTEHVEKLLLLIEAMDGSVAPPTSRSRAAAQSSETVMEGPGASPVIVGFAPLAIAIIAGIVAINTMASDDKTYGKTLTGAEPLAGLSVVGDPALLPTYADSEPDDSRPANADTLTLEYVRETMERSVRYGDAALLPEPLELIVALLPISDYLDAQPHETSEHRLQFDYLELLDTYPRIKALVAESNPEAIDPMVGDVRPGYAIMPLWIADDGSYGVGLPLTGTLSTGVDSRLGAYFFNATEPMMTNQPGDPYSIDAGSLVAYDMTELGRQMEYNNLRKQTLAPSALFWTVAIATWTGVQAVALAIWSMVEVVRRGAGTRESRRILGELREQLNKLALGLDLSQLDAVAVLGSDDAHTGKAAEADQRLYETMLLTAWREVQELESLPRRLQRGPEWRARIDRMQTVITALAERDRDVAARALDMVRTYN